MAMSNLMQTQSSGEIASGSINLHPLELSIIIDHTGFKALEECVASGIALKPLANKDMIHFLGAFILSDEIAHEEI